jgi:thymidylate kinase
MTKIICFEGIDGVGKTTLAIRVSRAWNATYIKCPSEYYYLNKTDCDYTNAMLHMADFYGIQDKIRDSEKVVLDRYLPSHLAYEKLSNAQVKTDTWIKLATGLIVPDITYFMALSPEKAQQRIMERACYRGEPVPEIESHANQVKALEAYGEAIASLRRLGWNFQTLDASKSVTELMVQDMSEYCV